MELRDVLRMMRSELGINQGELANELHVSYATVNRWEAGKTCPNRSILAVLREFSGSHTLSPACRARLEESIDDVRKGRIAAQKDALFSVEHASLRQLIDDAPFPIYVCDMETDELLYVNHGAAAMLGDAPARLAGRKCYECLMQRDSPCPFCRKDELTAERFTTFEAFRPGENAYHLVQGKLLPWNGRRAQVRYIVDLVGAQPLALRREGAAGDGMAESIARRLFHIDYETITAIDAETGEARPFLGDHIDRVIAEQKATGSNVAGVEAYLRKYCADDDVESVIRGTSLPYVKDRLETQSSYHITYSLRQGARTIYKRAVYAYLDARRTILICAMQDLTDLHEQENVRRNQLAEALQTLQEQTGMNLARYDLRTRVFYNNSEMASAAGYGSVVENVPEEFIEKGLVPPAFVEAYRAYYEELRAGKAGSLTVPCKVADGSFHWLRMDARLLRDRDGLPYQALLAFRDVDEERERAAVYTKWRQSLQRRQPGSYTLFRCNLSTGSVCDKEEGSLLGMQFVPSEESFNERTMTYAGRLVHMDDFVAYTELLNAENLLASYYRGVHKAQLDYRERTPGGSYRWLRLTVETAQYPDSADVEAFLLYEPLDRAWTEEKPVGTLRVPAPGDAGVVVIKCDWESRRFTYDETASQRLFGRYDGRPLWEIFLSDGVVDAEDLKALRALVHELAETPGRNSATMELRMKTPAKALHWFNFYALKQVDAGGRTVGVVLMFTDVHDDVLASKKLRFQAEHDSLTGLYNRSAFLLRTAVAVRGRPADAFVLLCSDINDFSFFNDRFGREEGDRLLRYAAERLRTFVGPKDGFSGRLSNDVFAVLLPNTPGVLERTEAAIRGFFASYPLKVKITGRAGAYIVSDPGMTTDAMLDRASMAKDAIKGRYDAWLAVYDAGMNEKRLHEKYIADRMETALAECRFDIHIQPQFHHATGQIVGAEALARWNDPERGMIPPSEFIPVFEKNGFITRLDEYVWEKTARCVSEWMARGHEPVPISVNVSREDADDPELCKKLLAIVEKYSLPSHIFRLEITESLFAEDTKRLAAVVEQLHAAGFLVEMDDFGSGYSSLNILKDVPVDVLKLDMKFFSGEDDLGRGGMIINAVLRMARWLGIPVIAEGVERKAQADFLLSLGCPTIQGYLYEKPLPVERFEALLGGGGASHAAPQNVIESLVDARGFWNPESPDSQLFNNGIGPAAVFEYHGGEYELLRMNWRFADALNLRGSNTALPDREAMRLPDEEKLRFKKAVLDAIFSGRDVRVDVRRCADGGAEQLLRITLRVIAKSADRALLFAELLP